MNLPLLAPWGEGRFERVLVYGLKVSGLAAARFLRRRGVAVIGVDQKRAEELDLGSLANDPGVELRLGADSATRLGLLDRLDAVVVSPGVPMDQPLIHEARAEGLPVIAEVELAFPALEAEGVNLAAITGSNGKSTVTEMLGAILSAAGRRVEVCGNIGTPVSDRVDRVDAETGTQAPGRAFVVELSSFQIEGIDRFRPDAAALLNISEDHLDRYPSLAAYADAKKRLFARMRPDGVAVLNADDPLTLDVETAARRRLFSRSGPVADGCQLENGWVVEVEPDGRKTPLFAVMDVPLAGLQNVENAMAAALLARALGAGAGAIRSALLAFSGLPHRLERVGEHDGVVWYDDSKGTNPAATMKSIEGFPDGSVHLILGGRNKGADLSLLAPLVARKARRVYLIGESADDFARVLSGAAPLDLVGTLDRAVQAAAGNVRSGEVVVLSPACASFDQFRNFEHRGHVFQELVLSRVLGEADEVGDSTGGPD
ncbi:MAG TPA: UDP-N-acetylmuramoyl-L-alanine--D-glutamate ligase [Thermoanaerobaculia bacterium]|nr:UDP-N-acetylmuramoyl-L-alanine--D-glutamate ligase [Thermoanaerobaculia bacterium]